MENKRQTKEFSIKKNLTMFFIGETGSGKSTLINMVVNILFGVEYEGQRKVAIPYTEKAHIDVDGATKSSSKRMHCNIEEFQGLSSESADDECKKSESQSQTTKPMIYGIKDKKTGKKISIIDTPGLNDTRGSKFDEEHVQNIINMVFCVTEVHMICIVHNATDARLKQSTEMALNKLIRIFSKSCLKNIVVCLSNSPKDVSPNCINSFKEIGIDVKNIFRFENDCLVHPDSLKELCKKEFGGLEEEVEDSIDSKKKKWRDNSRTVERFLNFGLEMENMDIESVKDIYHKREGIDQQIKVISDRVRTIEEKEKKLKKQTQYLEDCNKKAEENKNFTNSEWITTYKPVSKKIIAYRKEKKYMRYSVAKEKYKEEKWTQSDHNNFSLLCICTLGLAYLVDGVDSGVGDAFGQKIPEYYEWVDVPYEEIEIEHIPTKILVDRIDSLKKQEYIDAIKNGKSALELQKEIEKELNNLKVEKDQSFRLIVYMLKDLDKNVAGNNISIHSEIASIENEIKFNDEKLKRILSANSNFIERMSLLFSDPFSTKPEIIEQKIEELCNRKQRLLKLENIVKRARDSISNHQIDSNDNSDMFYLKKVLAEEEKNQSNKLEMAKMVLNSLLPCLINKESEEKVEKREEDQKKSE